MDIVTSRNALIVTSTALLAVVPCLAQLNCMPNPTTRQPLVCLVPDSSSAYANAAGLPPDQVQTVQAVAQATALPINGSIGAQLSQIPVPSGTNGTIFLDISKENPNGFRYDNLGPVLVDQPGTVGKGHLYGGFSYQHFNFNSLDGIDLKKLSFGFQGVSTNNAQYTFYGSNSTSLQFKLDQYVALLVYGATKTTDVSVVIPFNSVSASTTSTNFVNYTYDSQANLYQPFTTSGNPTVKASGSDSGIGDISFNVKQLVYGAEGSKLAVALGAGLRIPSGDVYNYLGSGAYGFNLYGLISYRSTHNPISPHVKLGSVWNGSSPLVNVNAKTSNHLPGGLQYAVGVDSRTPVKRLTLTLDVLGNQFSNATVLKPGTITLSPTPNAKNSDGKVIPLPEVDQPANSTYTAVSFGGGLKYKPFKTQGVLLYGNVLVQLNNVGLRSDPVPLGGISYNWGRTE